jgi:hypothetical protein
MCTTVVLEHESVVRIAEIGPPEEPTFVIVERNLDLRPRQSAQDEQHPKPALHRRLSRGLYQVDDAPELPDSPCPGPRRGELPKFLKPNKPGMQRHIRYDDGLYKRRPAGKVEHRADSGGCRHSAPHAEIAIRQRGLANRNICNCPIAAPTGDRCLYWSEWSQVEPVQPGGRPTGEARSRRELPNRGKTQVPTLLEARPYVAAIADPAPVRPLQLFPRETNPHGVGEGEWTCHEHFRNECTRAHDTTVTSSFSPDQPSSLSGRMRRDTGDRPLKRDREGDLLCLDEKEAWDRGETSLRDA